MITVQELNIYPIKSAAGFSVSEAIMQPKGFENDRRWMIIDENGKYITQRDKSGPKLVGLIPEILPEAMRVTFRDSGTTHEIYMDDVMSADPIRVQFKEANFLVFPAHDEINRDISELVGIKATLVYIPEDSPRQTNLPNARVGDDTNLSDNAQVLITNSASLAALDIEGPCDMANFRPNLVVDGAKPFAEDMWESIKIGDVLFDVVKPCPRCVIVNINQLDGEKNPDVLKKLVAYRRGAQWDDATKSVAYFGVYAIPRSFGKIAVGQSVNILREHAGYRVLADSKAQFHL